MHNTLFMLATLILYGGLVCLLQWKAIPKCFAFLYPKQVSGWCGSNSKISLWDSSISNTCPNCGLAKETSKHMPQCSHEGRVTLFRKSVHDMIVCLGFANVDMELTTMFEAYFLGQGSISMESLTPSNGSYRDLALMQDKLGWDCFVKGQIPIVLLDTIHPCLHQISPCKSISKWGVQIIKSLLGVTHRQWLFWNSNVHHRIDSLTSHQHSQSFDCIHSLLMTPISELLPNDRHLLQQDFHQLSNTDTIQCQLWVASMESAISAASHVATGHYTPDSLQIFNSIPSQPAPCWSPFTDTRSTQWNHPPACWQPQ